jgi:hypothetical protein
MADTETQIDWSQPMEFSALDIVFPTKTGHVMPAYGDIPEDFRNERGDARKWVRFQRQWFFRGVNLKCLTPKNGVDFSKAVNHLQYIQGSWEPKHEHKQAAVAYLASLWFDDVNLETAS